jgi:hypothetical protein
MAMGLRKTWTKLRSGIDGLSSPAKPKMIGVLSPLSAKTYH